MSERRKEIYSLIIIILLLILVVSINIAIYYFTPKPATVRRATIVKQCDNFNQFEYAGDIYDCRKKLKHY